MMNPLRDGEPPAPPGRLVSLDVFRGITIASMLLVNNLGDWDRAFSPLLHAEWHGCTATDLIFPFFLFIMGVAMPFSFSRRLEQGGRPLGLLPHVLKRGAILILLGLVLNLIFAFARDRPVRFAGVLQRIGLCSVAASMMVLWWRERGWVTVAGILLVGYYLLMTLVPVRGNPAPPLTQACNLSSWIDAMVLGRHCYEWDPKTGLGHDPEGLLSTLPAVATTLLGCLTGAFLRRREESPQEKANVLFAGGVALLTLGLWWSLEFPLNKNLWTSSYVLATGGWALLGLGVCFWLVDVKGWGGRWSKPFLVYGMNPIAAYVGASAMAGLSILIRWAGPDGKPIRLKTWIYTHFYESWIPPLFGYKVSGAAYAMTYVVLWCGITWVLYRKRIFIRI